MAEKSKKSNGHQSLLIDIGSASIGGALMVEHRTGVPELSMVKRVPIGTGSEEGKAILPATMQTALTELCKSYSAVAKHGVIRVVLAAPWHHAMVRTVQSQSPKPVSVTLKTVEHLIATYRDEKPPEPGRVDLEAVAVQVRVNGYATSLTQRVHGALIKVNLYESEIDQGVRTAVLDTLQRELPGRTVSLHSFPLVAGTALRIASVENSFLFADVGGEVTDLGLIHGDGIHFLASFPVGVQTILRTLGTTDTAARLVLLARGELAPEEAATAEAGLISAFKAWNDACDVALKEAAEHVPVPRTMFVMCDPDPLPWVMKGIGGNTLGLAPAGIDATFVQRMIELGTDATYDTFLALEALFFHTGLGEVIGEPAPMKMVYSHNG